ncbi:MAG: 1-deoxy-D-xylulose-5-phosphate synthase [Nitrospirae bacterium]|nr:1-deoxy-D-xylulose-5-phosphate synthase [Nitrospirota bacterium]MBF0533790.1 1-deoxy-D-xylulose-5-phosphate synthase [Nitrospirota bacterium]MBF0615501.1 1-deoxy-D-xylulose-5-phosphate synthase [Nitrospirota bacterium]
MAKGDSKLSSKEDKLTVSNDSDDYFSILSEVKSPEDIKLLSLEELSDLAREIRDVIIKRVSINGGHLASSLGVIELTLALHYVFRSPVDKIIWDVGHQCYPHKLITGRFGRFHTLRQHGGLSGFPRRDENPHDAFGTGHSSTSISAALGMAEGGYRLGRYNKVIAVIGDGALTGGLAFEGLNNAGHLKRDLIVVLNDNEMSISKNVGALSTYLTRAMGSSIYQKFKKETKTIFEIIPKVGGHFSKLAQRTEDTLKCFFIPGMLFEELGFTYMGPVDGHDIAGLIDAFESVKTQQGPILIHAITKKGKGYEFSEMKPSRFHGVGPFETDTGEPKKCAQCPSFSEIFGRALTEAAKADPKVVAITAAMKEGTGLREFAETFPGRFYDVGIAEQHAVTFAAGLAASGIKPVVAVYSTFLQRAYDEVIHDVCLQNLPVVFAIDRTGIVGEDGPTHHGLFDISFLRSIPNLTIMTPKNSTEMKDMLALAFKLATPCAIRYSRDTVPDELEEINSTLEPGKGEIIRDGTDVAILASGQSVSYALLAAKRLESSGVSASVVNMRFIKPLDGDLIVKLSQKVKAIVTVEENVTAGGFGSLVLEFLNATGLNNVAVKVLGIADKFVEHGRQDILRKLYGIDDDGIYQTVMGVLSK